MPEQRQILKAYSVQETHELTGGIVFARSNLAARKWGANELNDGELGGLLCRRAPWADHLAESGSVPAALMIENGWHFECSGCGAQIDEDWLAETEKPIDGVIGTQWSLVFCCAECKAAEDAYQAEKSRREAEAIEMLRAIVLRRFPRVSFLSGFGKEHGYCAGRNGIWITEQAFVSFEFPGMKFGPAVLRWDRPSHWRPGPTRPEFSVCAGDKEAFEAWAESPASRALSEVAS